MYLRRRLIGPCVVLVALLAHPSPLPAQSTGISGAPGPSIGDVCQITAGAITLGFGIWHFVVPELFGWWSYVPDAPKSLIEAVDATNFFFSFSLSLIGATNIAMPLIARETGPVNKYWLWGNVGLWTGRVAYQLIKPQGSHDPALQWGMLAAFVLTDALFAIAALDATF